MINDAEFYRNITIGASENKKQQEEARLNKMVEDELNNFATIVAHVAGTGKWFVNIATACLSNRAIDILERKGFVVKVNRDNHVYYDISWARQ